MEIDIYKPSDLATLSRIHQAYYQAEFDIDDLLQKALCTFVVRDKEDIITAGSVRTLAEITAVTNKDYSVRDRRSALVKLLDVSSYCAARYGYDSIHAFVQDENWYDQLKKHGFRPTVGRSLVTGV